MATTILDVSKKIIRKATEVGIDQAGSLLLPRSWKYFKIILMPIVKELEKKYPKMLLVDMSKPNVDNQKALESLGKDEQLQNLLNSGFSRLSVGQKKISADIQVINSKLDTIGHSIKELGGITREGFDDVLEAVNRSAGKQSKDWGRATLSN